MEFNNELRNFVIGNRTKNLPADCEELYVIDPDSEEETNTSQYVDKDDCFVVSTEALKWLALAQGAQNIRPILAFSKLEFVPEAEGRPDWMVGTWIIATNTHVLHAVRVGEIIPENPEDLEMLIDTEQILKNLKAIKGEGVVINARNKKVLYPARMKKGESTFYKIKGENWSTDPRGKAFSDNPRGFPRWVNVIPKVDDPELRLGYLPRMSVNRAYLANALAMPSFSGESGIHLDILCTTGTRPMLVVDSAYRAPRCMAVVMPMSRLEVI